MTIAQAFADAGLHRRDVDLDIALAKYLNSGGTIDGAKARLQSAAERMTGRSLRTVADAIGQGNNAFPGQSSDAAETGIGSPNGLGGDVSAASSDRGGRDQVRFAVHGHVPDVSPVREPSSRQRRVAAEVRGVIALTILDTFRIRDGRAIGDVRYCEIERLRAASAMEASIFRQIQRFAVAGRDVKIRDIIKPSDFQKMQQRAAEAADAL